LDPAGQVHTAAIVSIINYVLADGGGFWPFIRPSSGRLVPDARTCKDDRMDAMDGADVERAAAELVGVLAPHASRDWQVRAGGLDWNCWATAAHIAHDLFAYAGQVAARPSNAYLPFDLVVRSGTAPSDVLEIATAGARLLSTALSAARPDARAWHWGPTDPSGFAALGVNEILMHTYDITQGLGVRWLPPEQLCAGVLARLFPDAPAGDPVQVLLWCTGRIEYAGRSRRSSWVLKAAVE
jgi:hypothetical protein